MTHAPRVSKPMAHRMMTVGAMAVLALGALVAEASAAAAGGNCGSGPGSECTNAGSHIIVSPYTLLKNGQSVTISGTGFVADVKVLAEMCSAVVTMESVCDESSGETGPVTNSKGAFTGFVYTDVLQSFTTTGGKKVDCTYAGNCSIGAISATDLESKNPHSANEDVGFGTPPACGDGAGSECTNHGSHITVTPFYGLNNKEKVTISGTGFAASGKVSAEMCAAVDKNGNQSCDLADTAETGPTTNSKGAFSNFTFTVYAVIKTGAGKTIDCNYSGNCSVGVISNSDFTSKNPHAANEDVGFGSDPT